MPPHPGYSDAARSMEEPHVTQVDGAETRSVIHKALSCTSDTHKKQIALDLNPE